MMVSCGRSDEILQARITAPDVAWIEQITVQLVRIDCASVWRRYELEGYLQRKLHRPWRQRGS